MSPNYHIHNIILHQPNIILFTQNKINHHTFNIITKNTIIIIQFHLNLYNNTIFHINITNINTHTNKILLQLYTIIIITHPNNTSQLYTITNTIHHHINHITTKKHFIQLQININTIITNYHQNFHLSSSNNNTQKHSNT